MYTKSVIATTLFVILCIKLGQGLQCYQHDFCLLNACQNISQSVVECKNDGSRCWKLTTPAGGTQRGCGKDQCQVQINVGAINTGNNCCSENLCNSSVQIKTTAIAIVLMSLIAIMFQW